MLPSSAEFADAMGKLGIRGDDTVVVYDTKELGIFSAPRVAWTLRMFGHERVHVLNNFRLWVEQGLPVESGEPETPSAVDYGRPKVDTPAQVVDYEFVRQMARGKAAEGYSHASLLDARPKGRFDGADPEPRPGLPSGHVPGSISVPFSDVLDPTTKAFLPAEKLRELFAAKGVRPDAPVISSCGTGVTAVVLDAALEEAGYLVGGDATKKRLVYDGSWTEWAMRSAGEQDLIEKS